MHELEALQCDIEEVVADTFDYLMDGEAWSRAELARVLCKGICEVVLAIPSALDARELATADIERAVENIAKVYFQNGIAAGEDLNAEMDGFLKS